MHNYGDIIVSGGEAFNMYFKKNNRIITSDIDTKFIPIFKGPSGSLISTKSPKYFGYLQSVKVELWNILGEVAVKYNVEIKNRIVRMLHNTKIGKMLGISFPKKGPWVNRRYSLIQKKRHSFKTNKVSKDDVLIDVELFALDLKINYYSIAKKRIVPTNLGGILDIARMRPYEVGYEAALNRNQGVVYKNKNNGKMVTNKNVLFAGKQFLIEDVYLMQLLKLRPKKVLKDRSRMLTFAETVLNVKNIKSDDDIFSIFKKCITKFDNPIKISLKNRKIFKLKYNSDPMKYKKYTTEPYISKIPIVGLKSLTTNKIPGFTKTTGPYRFNIHKKKWIYNNSLYYIKNEMTNRPVNVAKKIPKVRFKDILYGYNPQRDSWMPDKLINKAAMIPIVGLKNTSFIY